MRRGKPRRPPPHVHRKTAKGNVYYYFDTGAKRDGKPILKRLPDIENIEFGPAYVAATKARNRKPLAKAMLTVRGLVGLFEASPEFDRHAPNTKKAYLTYMNVLVDQIGNGPAEEVERKDIVLLMDKMAKRRGAANMLLSVTGAVYTWGRKRGHVTARPTLDIGYFDTEDYEPWPDDLVEAALIDPDPFVRQSVALLFFTAQRVGDICNLKWSNLRDGRVQLCQQKRKVEVDFHIHERLLPHLGKPAGIFVLTRDGQPVATEDVRKALQAWAKARGHKIVPHGLRKNAVNSLLEAGCSVAETAAVSGQTLQIVEHYAKRRNKGKLGGAAILKWQNGSRT